MVSDALAPGHLLVVLLVALVVLGPTEIPKAVRAVARVRRQVAQLRSRLDDGLHSLLDVDEPAPGPAEVDSA
jgi:Sec-independent protein translocase protein TatA